MAKVTLKWELESKNFDRFKEEIGEEAVKVLNIGNNHCKACVLASGPMCIKRSVCRIPQNEIWINKEITEEKSTEDRRKYSDIFKEWIEKAELASKDEIELSEDFCSYLDNHFDTELIELLNSMSENKDKIHNMASCMLSILDSLMLYDNEHLELGDETLSEVMFRKMKAYNIDLNKELGFDHLKPVTKKKNNE